MWRSRAFGISVCVAVVVCVFLLFTLVDRRRVDYSAFERIHCSIRSGTSNQTQLIPKKIYRTWKTDQLPPIYQKAWEYTEKHNPEYEQVLYTDAMGSAFMSEFMGGFAKYAYEMLVPGAARADLLRYCIMYENGGVYLDGKSGAGPLRNLIGAKDGMIVSTWGSILGRPEFVGFYRFGEFQQWWLACRPRHPFMEQLIRSVVASIESRINRRDLMKHSTLGFWYNLDVLKLTGPLKYTEEIIRYMSENGSGMRMVCANGNGVMVYDVSGEHPSGAGYNKPGPILRNPFYVWKNYYGSSSR